MPLPPQEVAREEERADLAAPSDAESTCRGAGFNEDTVYMEHEDRDEQHCLKLGLFLLRVMRERTVTLRALLGYEDSGHGNPEGVPWNILG